MFLKNKLSYRFAYGILIILVFSFSLKIESAKAGLMTCLDGSGNVAYVIDDIYSCPVGTTSGNTNTQAPTLQQGLMNNNSTPSMVNNNPMINQSQTNIVSKPETIINFDPSLAYGAFVNLDPTDYKYCVVLSRDLLYGSRDASSGNEVSALQSYLTDRGYLEYGATGYFGRATDLAVRKFQYRNELEVTGSTNEETRQIINELTCTKQMVYVDKPVSPSKVKAVASSKVTTTTAKTTVIPATKASTAASTVPKTTPTTPSYVSVTPTTNTSPATTINNTQTTNILSSQGGNMSITQKNNLYFTYNTFSTRPFICITLNNADCSNSANYAPVAEGILKNFYEVMNITGQWVFTIYNGNTWGLAGSRIKVYLKENSNSSSVSIYTINVVN
ncbi:MAG: putative peptidoglycan binding domain [Candidatus Parcubacteria bacterium]|jgi:peptidoglycan hydrolase-like protein with peptidoglycan-binding domain